MSMALARSATAYGVRLGRVQRAAADGTLGDRLAKVVILVLFTAMAVRLANDVAETGHLTGMLLLASEALVVVLTLFRRSAATVDRSWKARILTLLSTFGPPLVQPASLSGLAPESVTFVISAIGLVIVVFGKLSLGRSFGLTPANRGVVSTGLYRLVRHPIYLGYLMTHVGFVIANPAGWNLMVLLAADAALLLRAKCEERTLAADDAYRAYMGRVHWRVVPGVF